MDKFNPKKTKSLKMVNRGLRLFFHTPENNRPFLWNDYNEILVLDFTAIGDIVMLTPFLRVLKKSAPQARITLVCCAWGKSILENEDLVDQFVILDRKTLDSPCNMAKSVATIGKALRRVNTRHYDVALEPRGDLRHIFFMHFCNAERKVSYNYTGGECLLTDVVVPSASVKHLIEDKLYFLSVLGCNYTKKDVYPRLHTSNAEAAEKLRAKLTANGQWLIGIHPGASVCVKEWPYYDELLPRLHRKYPNAAFLIFEGPKEEAVAGKVLKGAAACGATAYHIKSDMKNYMLALSVCDMVICNDSGAGHISAAYEKTAVVVFGASPSEIARPWGENVWCISHDLPCKPCLSAKCRFERIRCLETVTVEEVFETVCKAVKQLERKELVD